MAQSSAPPNGSSDATNCQRLNNQHQANTAQRLKAWRGITAYHATAWRGLGAMNKSRVILPTAQQSAPSQHCPTAQGLATAQQLPPIATAWHGCNGLAWVQ
ncbi:hypothetical protein NKT77_09735 [Moraxella sp. FZLJ2107]|uniref:hypothetical protein n=1 Tax=Moraxella sp. FZLJ2107 TaxID=2961618 RepID=UPI0020C83D06|nr:hypothetical protein [Moraxella sp. FZLJ2107]UTO04767.1 hypothetical protein NKT77_09735 [Moraxella sp. FZLJ2107]